MSASAVTKDPAANARVSPEADDGGCGTVVSRGRNGIEGGILTGGVHCTVNKMHTATTTPTGC